LSEPLVSVLIPCYNCADYIYECVNSICEQDYLNLEVLVCDDGSTDNSLSVIRKLAESDLRIKVYENNENIGKIGTINRLITETKGLYIAFLDSDDYVAKEKISLQVQFLQLNSDFSLCGTGFARVDIKGNVFEKIYLPKNDKAIRQEVLSATGMPVCCGSILAVGEFVRKVIGYRDFFHDCSGEDVDFISRLLDYGKGENLEYIGYYYRYRPFSLTRRVFSTVKQRHSHQIISFLSEERWINNKKLDALDHNSAKLKDYIAELSKPYEDDPKLMSRKMAYDHALNGDFKHAFKMLYEGVTFNYKSASLKCFILVFVIILFPNNFLLKAKSIFGLKNIGSKL